MERICIQPGCDADISHRSKLAKRCEKHPGKGNRKAQQARATESGKKAERDRAYRLANPAKRYAWKKSYRWRKSAIKDRSFSIRTCTRCKSAFQASFGSNAKYCSDICRTNLYALHFIKCKACKAYFTSRKSNRVACSACFTVFKVLNDRQRARAYQKLNPDVDRRKRHKRRKHYRGNKSIPKGTFEHLVKKQRGVCVACQCKPKRNNRLTYDHIIPISMGGENDLSNLQLLCHKCNSSKGNKNDSQWRRSKFGYLL